MISPKMPFSAVNAWTFEMELWGGEDGQGHCGEGWGNANRVY